MTTTFILGAGFSLAANAQPQVGAPPGARSYPLATSLRSCFDQSYSLSSGIEAAFAEAEVRGDHAPLSAMVQWLLEADHYFGAATAKEPGSIYRRFVQTYPDAAFLSFNYDALLEFSLAAERRWVPGDGFGVAADATLARFYKGPTPISSSAQPALHLHGSLYLYPREFEIMPAANGGLSMISIPEAPEFCFDPDANASHFAPFQKGRQDERYKLPPERIIAPVPDKAPELAQDYVKLIYHAAVSVSMRTTRLVCVGYSFAPTDKASYSPILKALPSGALVLLVSPDAPTTIARLRTEFPELKYGHLAQSFEDWGKSAFRIPSKTMV